VEGKGELEERWRGEKDEMCGILVIVNERSTKRVSHRQLDVSANFQEHNEGKHNACRAFISMSPSTVHQCIEKWQ
jgi:hypothetical protein